MKPNRKLAETTTPDGGRLILYEHDGSYCIRLNGQDLMHSSVTASELRLGELAAEVSEVEVEDSGDLRAVLRSGGEVLRLGDPPYRERVATFLRLRQELTRRCPHAAYFDLRFHARIVAMEPAAADEGPAASAGLTREARGGAREVVRY